MEFCILEEIEWRVMPRCSTTSSLLFMTGLLNNLPGICVETLGTCIIHSYSQVRAFRTRCLFVSALRHASDNPFFRCASSQSRERRRRMGVRKVKQLQFKVEKRTSP
jgi:ferric iron reductase protein FhuF